jgi:hypothetical protein
LNRDKPNVAKAPTFPVGANFSVGAKIRLKKPPLMADLKIFLPKNLEKILALLLLRGIV